MTRTEIDGPSRLPLGVRRRLGREVRSDLEGAYTVLRARGVPPEQAWARARALVLPDAAAWNRLATVHRPLHAVLADRLSARAVERTERVAVVAVASAALVVVAAPLVALGPGSSPSPYLVPVLGFGLFVATALVGTAYRLLGRAHADPGATQAHLRTVLALLATTLIVGCMGALADTYAFARRAASTAVTLSETMAWLGATAHLLATTLGLALGGALGWFLLVHTAAQASGDLSREPWFATPPTSPNDRVPTLEMPR